jgi:hypothetical protein
LSLKFKDQSQARTYIVAQPKAEDLFIYNFVTILHSSDKAGVKTCSAVFLALILKDNNWSILRHIIKPM